MGIDATENVLKYAHESGHYKETNCFYLGVGTDKFPEDLKNRFDVVVASGIWLVGHVPAQGMLDAYSALKVGGCFVTALRKKYWVDGEACGYKDVI